MHPVGYKIARATTPPQASLVKTDHTAIDGSARAPSRVKPVELRAPSAKVLGAGGTGHREHDRGGSLRVLQGRCRRRARRRSSRRRRWRSPTSSGTVSLTLTKITKLCTPVNKNGEDPTAPQHVGHLVCYQAKLPRGPGSRRDGVGEQHQLRPGGAPRDVGRGTVRPRVQGRRSDHDDVTTTTTTMPLGPCSAPQWPTCGGTCPVGNVCLPGIDFCACVPSDNTCGLSGAPTCGGTCPNGDVCTWVRRHRDLDLCGCVPPDQTCGFSEAPTCGGTCPSGTVCGQLSGGNVCGCDAPDSCSFAEAPTCGGTCPLGICVPNGSGCRCDLGCLFCGSVW